MNSKTPKLKILACVVGIILVYIFVFTTYEMYFSEEWTILYSFFSMIVKTYFKIDINKTVLP